MYSMPQRSLAEVLGTAALVLVGPGTIVATLHLAGAAKPAVTEGDVLAIALAHGLVLSALVYALGKVSGCHLNPAVTFAFAVTRRFPWKDVPVYWSSQYAGALLGALGIWAVYGQEAVKFGMGQSSFGAGTSYPAAMLAEAIATGLLVFAIFGIVDSRSPGQFAGLVIGGALACGIIVFGPITGASLNPARAFGPELVQAIAGGTTFWIQYVPVYLVPGLIGAAAAAFAYDFLANQRLVAERSTTKA